MKALTVYASNNKCAGGIFAQVRTRACSDPITGIRPLLQNEMRNEIKSFDAESTNESGDTFVPFELHTRNKSTLFFLSRLGERQLLRTGATV